MKYKFHCLVFLGFTLFVCLSACKKEDTSIIMDYRVKRILQYDHFDAYKHRNSTIFYENNQIKTIIDSVFYNWMGELSGINKREYTYSGNTVERIYSVFIWADSSWGAVDKIIYRYKEGRMTDFKYFDHIPDNNTNNMTVIYHFDYSGHQLSKTQYQLLAFDSIVSEWSWEYNYKNSKLETIKTYNLTEGCNGYEYRFYYNNDEISHYYINSHFSGSEDSITQIVKYSSLHHLLLQEDCSFLSSKYDPSLKYSREYNYNDNQLLTSIKEMQYGWCSPDAFYFQYEPGSGNLDDFMLPSDKVFTSTYPIPSFIGLNHFN